VSLSAEDRIKLAALKQDLPQKFRLQITAPLREQLKAISQNPALAGLEYQLKATITKLAHDPKYKGLQSHKYESLHDRYGKEIWESYVQNNTPGAWRLFWFYGPGKDEITLVLATPHP
jgi:hypothetical protein